MVKATTASAVQRIAAESRKVRPGAAVILSVIGIKNLSFIIRQS